MNTKVNKQLGSKIKLARNNANLSQADVAEELDIPRPSVSQIEQGKRDITAVELVKLSKLLNVNIKDLLRIDDKPKVRTGNDNFTKLTFLRHGEAMDDLYNQYGGWADPDLSARGINKAFQVAEKLKKQNEDYNIIYSSPLKRAKQKAEVLSRELNVELKVVQYLKERNTYGLLCGMNKDIAKKNFPELVEAYESDEYVLGSERYEDFVKRLKLLFDFIKDRSVKRVICVTHQKLLRAIISEHLSMNPKELDDGCKLVVGLDKKGLFYIESEGITFSRNKS